MSRRDKRGQRTRNTITVDLTQDHDRMIEDAIRMLENWKRNAGRCSYTRMTRGEAIRIAIRVLSHTLSGATNPLYMATGFAN